MQQMNFDFGQAVEYMKQVFGFEERRETLNTEMSTARTLAKDQGVPTKAVEIAIRAERNHRRALAVVSQEEFDALRAQAKIWVDMMEEAQALGDTKATPKKMGF